MTIPALRWPDRGAPIATLATGLNHPEGVVWCAERAVLYAGGERGELYRVGLDGRVEQFAATGSPGAVLGLALDAAGHLYVCDEGGRRLLRADPDTAAIEVVSTGTAERPMIAPNFPAFDRSGRLLVTDSGTWGSADGVIFAVDPRGATTLWSADVPRFPNGLALAADGASLYVVESAASAVVRIPIDASGSAAAPPQPVFHLPGSVPDGLALDVAGNLYVACYSPDAIFVVTPSGTVECLVHDWTGQTLSRPTNVAFAGPDLDVLVSANLGGLHLTRIDASATGLPLIRPGLIAGWCRRSES